MLTRRRVLAAKIESSPGVVESITDADGGILIINPTITTNIEMEERKVLNPSLSNLPDLPGTQGATLTFSAELKGAGTTYAADNVPAIGKYLQACGFSETVDTTAGSETVIYQPISDNIPTLTMWLYEDGVVKKIRGAQGTFKINAEDGKPLYVDFTFTGVWDGIADASVITPTFETSVPPVLLNANFSVDSYAAKISKLDIDMANTIQLLQDISDTTGFAYAMLTERKPNGTMDPETTNIATYDWFGKWLAGATGALSISVGDNQYNKFSVSCPAVQYTNIGEADRNGIAINDITFKLNQGSDAGDDEIQVVFS